MNPDLFPEKVPTAPTAVPLGSEVLPPEAPIAAADTAARALAVQIGYRLPGDSTNPDLICRDIAANSRRTVEACLEMGKGLIVLRSLCEHGDFTHRVEDIGIDRGVAQRFMHAARKFSNAATSRHLLPVVGSQSKLLELLVLDDDQVDELAETGQTGELKLDDVACMGVRELRQAVRKLRTDVAAKDGALKMKEQRISALEEEGARRSGGGNDDDDDGDGDDGDSLMLDAEREVRDSVMEVKKTLEFVHSSIAALRRAADAAGGDGVVVSCDEVVYHACRDVIAAARRLAADVGVPLIINPDVDDTTEDMSGTHMPVDPDEAINEFWIKQGVTYVEGAGSVDGGEA
ncbi:MAG: hypothetical protein LBE85_14250 [Candidatus Accumulibacter sp.]|jgi:hypothetical protein|nr:hypothetical protein [Accumulibacter sp.]